MYLHGNRLAWVKEACEPEALRRKFRLEFHPADAYRKRGYRKRNYFTQVHGMRFDGKCLGAARLPDFALARARLGQSALGGEWLWEAEVSFDE